MSDMEGKISKEHIRQVLLDINPIVRQFHKNVIELHTGINPAMANQLGPDESIRFLRHVWGSCLDWGNQRMDFIGDSVQQLEDFLNLFQSEKEIHDLHVFLERLEKYPTTKHITSASQDVVVRQTELLQKFHSVGIKTAALIMRFLCLDCDFFTVDKSRLIPPLDRVNYRMCKQLFDRKYVLRKLGRERASFGKRANTVFDDLGKYVLGEKKILIDNLWFIGHFYHDGRDCKVREGAKIVDFPCLRDIELPRSCLFLKHDCLRSS